MVWTCGVSLATEWLASEVASHLGSPDSSIQFAGSQDWCSHLLENIKCGILSQTGNPIRTVFASRRTWTAEGRAQFFTPIKGDSVIFPWIKHSYGVIPTFVANQTRLLSTKNISAFTVFVFRLESLRNCICCSWRVYVSAWLATHVVWRTKAPSCVVSSNFLKRLVGSAVKEKPASMVNIHSHSCSLKGFLIPLQPAGLVACTACAERPRVAAKRWNSTSYLIFRRQKVVWTSLCLRPQSDWLQK